MDIVCQLKDSNEETWMTAWAELAGRIQARAEEADKNGKSVTASTAYLRASTYWRCALLYLAILKMLV
ncbi:hypothetical protein ACFOGQ_11115 [Acinetobacter vivianii]